VTLAREYDRWHGRLFGANPAHADESSPWYNLVTEYLIPLEGKKVLEIACGRGGFTALLTARGAEVVGSDFSHTALRIASNKGAAFPSLESQPTLAQADAHHLPYASNCFDVVISCETIEHLLDPAQGLREMGRVARPGALLYLTTPNYLNATGLYSLYASIRHPARSSGTDQPLDNHYFFFQVKQFLRLAGWRILRTDGTVHQFPLLPGHDPVRFEFLESTRFLRRGLRAFALHYLVIARKPDASE
jgi:ubiquinone/menaquinone biosynthesis C-methylase UbiE